MPSPELQKRHFAAIASAIFDAMRELDLPDRGPITPYVAAKHMARHLAVILRAYNPAFDRARFMEAATTGIHYKTALHRARRGT